MKRFLGFRNKKVIITGGMGFIGSNVAHRLVGLGSKITVIDNLLPSYGGNYFNIADIKNKINISISDIRDLKTMSRLIKKQDYLFSLAGQTSHIDSMTDPYTDLDINSRAQLSILEACRKHNPAIKIVFASTRQIYGKPVYLPVDEKHPLVPIDVNGINKMAGEWYYILYKKVYGIRSCILRLTNTYGPRMRVKDDRQTFVGVWIRQLIQGRPFEVWGGEQLRDFTYVDDAVDAILMVAADKGAYGQVFNLGGNEVLSLKRLAKLLLDSNGAGSYVIRAFPPNRKKIDIGSYYSDYKKIKKALGWEPKISLRDGVARTIEFYRDHLKDYL